MSRKLLRYLVLGSGWSVYRLTKYSDDSFSKVLPQFVVASIGVAAIGARSLHALFYNMFWRSYPIDPMVIAKELKQVKDEKNLVDWVLFKVSTASLVYSFYYHYNFAKTGTLVVIGLTVMEILCSVREIPLTEQTNTELSHFSRAARETAKFVKNLPFPPATFWILSTELFGRAVENPLCRLANVPHAISVWAFPREGFYTGWSIEDTINDYIMLSYLIVFTEGLCQVRLSN